jgi:hypothetical protein
MAETTHPTVAGPMARSDMIRGKTLAGTMK